MTTYPALGQIEGVFGFTFTEPERHLLTTPTDLLGVYEQQDRYVLLMSLQTCQCPACGYLICQRSAAGGPLLTSPRTSRADDDYTCPNCQERLTWHLSLIGGAQWFTRNAVNANAAALADAERRFVFRNGQQVWFRDRSTGAERQPGTFIRDEKNGHVLVERGSDHVKVRTDAGLVEPACICKGREGHTDPDCPFYGTDGDVPARPQFIYGQDIEFRDRARGAEWEPGTFGSYQPGGLSAVHDAHGKPVLTPSDRVRPAPGKALR